MKQLLIDPQSRDSASFFVSVKCYNCVSECNQALKNHQIFLRANKSIFPKRSDQKTQQSIVTSLKNLGGGEKVFVFARMQKMERFYKGKKSYWKKTKYAQLFEVIERRKTKERSENSKLKNEWGKSKKSAKNSCDRC